MFKLGALLILATACSHGGAVEVESQLEAPGLVSYPEDIVTSAPSRLPPLTVCLYDVGASDDVRLGVEAWAEALKPWRDVVLSDSGCNLTIFEVGQHAGLCQSEHAAGCTTQIGGLEQSDPNLELFLYRGNYESLATGATMHEIGHLLGLTHSDVGLMRADMERGSVWTTPDEATLDRLSDLLHVEL